MAIYRDIEVTERFLDNNPNAYFIFGDNLERRGTGGAARLRQHPHAFGFIIKKFPDNNDTSFYRPEEYSAVFFEELDKLYKFIKKYPDKNFYISKLGSGLANKYRIWEKLIHHNLTLKLENFNNVIFCWQENMNVD
jgi:hypothetical protein